MHAGWIQTFSSGTPAFFIAARFAFSSDSLYKGPPPVFQSTFTPGSRRRTHFGVKFSGFEIQNIVGSYDVKFKIPLSDLRKNILIKNHCNYEPEIFPGLIYHPECEANITLSVFSSGKIIISGGKKTQQIYDELNKFYPFLIKYNNWK